MPIHRKVERKKSGTSGDASDNHKTYQTQGNPKVGREGINKNVQKKSPQGSQTDREIGETLHRMDETLGQESKTLTASH